MLKEKTNQLQTIAKALIPTGANLEKLLALIRPANEICNLHSPVSLQCPLCRQELQEKQLELFKNYACLLTNELKNAIDEINGHLNEAADSFEAIKNISPENWGNDSVLNTETITLVKAAGTEVKKHFGLDKKISEECQSAAAEVKKICAELKKTTKEKEELIQDSVNNRSNLLKQLTEVSEECLSLLYRKKISENFEILKEAHHRIQEADFLKKELPIFTTVLRKVTLTAKLAYKELVVSDFKKRLNHEYMSLAERDMSAFGVDLKDVGGDGAVTVDPRISEKKLEIVLSEGEQRIHALALFFAELESCQQQVIVFDDPISSFDYNYIANYCGRLRKFIQMHPNRQIIVFTHNWEFFVQLQTTLNNARLNNDLSVCVLENCVAIDEYSEKIDCLKTDIEAVLNSSSEPSKEQKEITAGKMRRLIEALINTHVFNNQRHQYRQKSRPVSEFYSFTNIVPLLQNEAEELRDLYAKLSITEHDDPRNAYLNTDRAMFLNRYDTIKKIEKEILSRKKECHPAERKSIKALEGHSMMN